MIADRRKYLQPGGERVPNLAPLVDVIMVLLIFFLLGATLDVIKEGALQTELDASSGPGGAARVSVIPTIEIALENVADGDRVNIYVLDGLLEDNTFHGLETFMRQRRVLGADPSNPVVIGAGTTVRWRFVVRAMDAAIRAGFKNVQFAVSFDDT